MPDFETQPFIGTLDVAFTQNPETGTFTIHGSNGHGRHLMKTHTMTVIDGNLVITPKFQRTEKD